jgi:16S rRNA (uracil1498-N3)-methyltransferase
VKSPIKLRETALSQPIIEDGPEAPAMIARMHPRFHAPQIAPDNPLVELPPDEADHLVRVLRLRAGDKVRVFDGHGHEFLARIESTGRGATKVRLLEPLRAPREPSVRMTLALVVLKGEKVDAVVRDATMLGVARLQPIVSARAEVSASAVRRSHRVDRWRRIALSSAKQCGRAFVPTVEPPLGLEAFIEADTAELRLILTEPAEAAASEESLASLEARPAPATASLLIGPEGGWTGEEIAQAKQRGFLPLTLGTLTLRADAAPLVALSVLLFAWGEL